MKKFKLFGLLSLAVALVLTACSGGGSSKAEFKVAIGGEPQLLDTALSQDSITHYITAQLYDTLYSYDQQGNLIPNLAESTTVSDDGLTYTVKLVDTVWSDGEKVTADQVVYAAKRSLNLGPESYYGYYIHKYVENTEKYIGKPIADMTDIGITAVDDLTVQFKLIKPIPFFQSLLTGEVFSPQREDVAVEGESTWANEPGNPTTGGYTLKSLKQGREYVVEKNPNYRFADKMTLETIKFVVMEDQQAQLNAFKTGEIDFATSVPSDVVHTFEGKPELTLFQPYVVNYWVTINSFGSVEELKDVNIRRALQLAIDRDQVLQALNGGEIQYPLYGFVPKGIPGANGDFREEADAVKKLAVTNKEEAKKLMEAAGYTASNPLKLTYSYNASSTHDTVAQSLQAMWKEVGFDVTLTPAEVRVFFDDRENANFQLARHAMSADYLDPMIYLDMYATNSQKVPVVSDPVYDAMLDASNKERDAKKRMELLHAAEKYLVEEMAYVAPIFGYSVPYLIKAGVKNVTSNPQGSLDLRFVELP